MSIEPTRSRTSRHATVRQAPSNAPPRFGLARILSKRGFCSRTQAVELIRNGHVAVNGAVVCDPEAATDLEHNHITVNGIELATTQKTYLMLNKPRGYVTTASDERGRETVYSLLVDPALPWLAPVGRLDKASEGLLLFSNDSMWAAKLMSPESHIHKTYHVQIDCRPDNALLSCLREGIRDGDDQLKVKSVCELRHGEKTSWLEIVLDEGKNRHIRRLFALYTIGVLRLLRVAVGSLTLGNLAKGQWRYLTAQEMVSLRRSSGEKAIE